MQPSPAIAISHHLQRWFDSKLAMMSSYIQLQVSVAVSFERLLKEWITIKILSKLTLNYQPLSVSESYIRIDIRRRFLVFRMKTCFHMCGHRRSYQAPAASSLLIATPTCKVFKFCIFLQNVRTLQHTSWKFIRSKTKQKFTDITRLIFLSFRFCIKFITGIIHSWPTNLLCSLTGKPSQISSKVIQHCSLGEIDTQSTSSKFGLLFRGE